MSTLLDPNHRGKNYLVRGSKTITGESPHLCHFLRKGELYMLGSGSRCIFVQGDVVPGFIPGTIAHGDPPRPNHSCVGMMVELVYVWEPLGGARGTKRGVGNNFFLCAFLGGVQCAHATVSSTLPFVLCAHSLRCHLHALLRSWVSKKERNQNGYINPPVMGSPMWGKMKVAPSPLLSRAP